MANLADPQTGDDSKVARPTGPNSEPIHIKYHANATIHHAAADPPILPPPARVRALPARASFNRDVFHKRSSDKIVSSQRRYGDATTATAMAQLPPLSPPGAPPMTAHRDRRPPPPRSSHHPPSAGLPRPGQTNPLLPICQQHASCLRACHEGTTEGKGKAARIARQARRHGGDGDGRQWPL